MKRICQKDTGHFSELMGNWRMGLGQQAGTKEARLLRKQPRPDPRGSLLVRTHCRHHSAGRLTTMSRSWISSGWTCLFAFLPPGGGLWMARSCGITSREGISGWRGSQDPASNHLSLPGGFSPNKKGVLSRVWKLPPSSPFTHMGVNVNISGLCHHMTSCLVRETEK